MGWKECRRWRSIVGVGGIGSIKRREGRKRNRGKCDGVAMRQFALGGGGGQLVMHIVASAMLWCQKFWLWHQSPFPVQVAGRGQSDAADSEGAGVP